MTRAKDMLTARGKLGGYTALVKRLEAQSRDGWSNGNLEQARYEVGVWRAKLNAIPLKRKRRST